MLHGDVVNGIFYHIIIFSDSVRIKEKKIILRYGFTAIGNNIMHVGGLIINLI